MSKLLDRAVIMTDPATVIATYTGAPSIAFDLETSGLDRFADEVMVVALAAPGLPTAVLHVAGHFPPGLIELLNTTPLIGHNITTFDIPFLVKYGFDIANAPLWVDTMILEQLCIVSDRRGVAKTLKATAKRRIGVEIDKDIDHRGWTAAVLTAEQLSYAALDVQHLHKVYAVQLERLQELGLTEAWETEQAAFKATAFLASNGMPMVPDDILHFVEGIRADLAASEAKLRDLTGRDFNPSSSMQVKQVFADLGIALASSDVDALHAITSMGGKVAELAVEVTHYRKLKKAMMYDEAWLSKYVSTDGRVRSSYRQCGTDTGRYSCSDPNLQQWPRNLRNLIGYPEASNWRLLSVDYSQIEILIAAVLSQEHHLVDAVLNGDVHTFVASMVFGIPVDQVDSAQRKKGKAAGFTLLFAGGATGVIRSAASGGLLMTPEEASVVRDKFFSAFPAVASYIAHIRKVVDIHTKTNRALTIRVPLGPVRSLFGPSLTASTAVNTLIQGAAAVGLKRALRRIVDAGLGQYLAAVVHDEVVLAVPADRVDAVREQVEASMIEGVFEVIGVRPKVEAKVGYRWG